MPYYLAIDAGGTSTRAILADDSRVLAGASNGSIKLQRVSEGEATARLTAMLQEVSAGAGVALNEVTRTCIGLAGLTIPAVRAWAERTFAATVSGEVLLLGDEEIALDAAFPDAAGILLIAGTGSNCIGRAADGTLHRAGGWGPILGDEGGGYWIGLEALRAALRSLDGEGGTASAANELLTAIQQRFCVATLAELIELGNRRSGAVPDFASLAPVISEAAAADNPIALSILTGAAEHLARLICAVAARLDPDAGDAAIAVAFAGSILAEIPGVHAALRSQLSHSLPTARLHSTAIDPLLGAVYRARRG